MDKKNGVVNKLNKKTIKYIKIFVTVAIIAIVAWFVIIYPKITFSKNEDKFIEASKRYFEVNSNRLPNEGQVSTVTLQTLYHQKYVSDIKTVYTKDSCNIGDSWVKVKREQGEYKYTVYLECGIFKSNVDHDGPVITLNGEDQIEIEKNSKFTDPGIKSVKDKTDGTIDNSKVTVKGTVDTSKVGTYKITYTISDSMLNKTEKVRTVIVSQNLSTTVKNDTDKSNVYKGSANNNYVSFSGKLFRIVGLNSDGTVKIVSNEDVGSINYDDINDWLNDVYYESLADDSKKLLVTNYKWCEDQVGEKELTTRNKCVNNTNKSKVGILSLADYNKSLEEGYTYLYPTSINWMSDTVNKKSAWTTRTKFIGTDSKYYYFNKDYNFSVRPALILKKGIKITDGEGTYTDPYIIDNFKTGKVGDKINTRYSGEYVEYGNSTYRIVEVEDGYTKVVSKSSILNLEVKYDNSIKTKVYNPTEKGNVGYYIENESSKYIKSDIFVKRKISVPIYSNNATYKGKKTTKEYSVKFSAPSIYDLYSSVNSYNYWLKESSKKENVKYVVSDNATIYYTNLYDDTQAGVRISGYIKKSATILSGKGTEADPYVITK